MINFKHLDHVLICVPLGKTEEARQFYTNVLGLEEIPGNHPKGAIWFNMADIQLHVREEDGGNYSDRHIAFEINNLEEAKQYLQSKGVNLAYSTDISGRQRFFFRDPFENRIELLEFEDPLL